MPEPAVEFIVVEGWLYEALAEAFTPDMEAAPSVPIFSGAGTQDAEYPFVVFAYLDGNDVWGVGPARYLTHFDYKVIFAHKAESWLDLLDGAATIDAAIHGKSGSPNGGGTVLSCVRAEPFVQREVVDGVVYASLGGVYRIQAQT